MIIDVWYKAHTIRLQYNPKSYLHHLGSQEETWQETDLHIQFRSNSLDVEYLWDELSLRRHWDTKPSTKNRRNPTWSSQKILLYHVASRGWRQQPDLLGNLHQCSGSVDHSITTKSHYTQFNNQPPKQSIAHPKSSTLKLLQRGTTAKKIMFFNSSVLSSWGTHLSPIPSVWLLMMHKVSLSEQRLKKKSYGTISVRGLVGNKITGITAEKRG